LRALLAIALAACAAQAAGQYVPKSDWELEREREDRKESQVKLPAYPKDGALVEFAVSNASSFRFFIDAASISVEPGDVVRYTLVARSSSGVSNVSYEAIRCGWISYYKVLAYGSDGRWTARESDWREIENKPVQRWHHELRLHYFCPSQAVVANVAEAVNALRRGGHRSVQDSERPRY